MAENKQVEVKETELELITKEYTASAGNKFLGYHTYFGKSLKRVTLKFTQDCNIIPKEDGYIMVSTDKISLDTRSKYPILWVREVVKFTKKADLVNNQPLDLENLPF